jgi:RNA polymerase sigma-70 factor (ECF subfamily)
MAENPPALDIAELVAEHHAAVYRYAYRLTGAECDAEDLTQQTFLAAQVNLGQLRDAEHGRSWLYAILRNGYLKMRRKRIPFTAASLELDIDGIPDELPEIAAVDPERLQMALDELPDEFKLPVLLFYYEGCSYREIAEKLATPPGTVMSRLSRAKAHLRSKLFEEELHAAAGSGVAGSGAAGRQNPKGRHNSAASRVRG